MMCVDVTLVDRMINEAIENAFKNIKVQIPQSQINDAVVKFFTEKKWFLTEDGKKLDTYDLIRKFAMNTIGVAENGELKPEFLKIVQDEVAKLMIDKANIELSETSQDEFSEEPTIIERPLDTYSSGWVEGVTYAIECINNILKDEGNKFQFWQDNDHIINIVKRIDDESSERESTIKAEIKMDKTEQLKERFENLSPETKEALHTFFEYLDGKNVNI